jgi:ATP-dependent Clp protease protease subunit
MKTKTKQAATAKVVQLPSSAPPRSWYSISARGNRSAEIAIHDEIGGGWFGEGVKASQFVKDLKALGDVDTLDVRINSMGGIVSEGLTIYRALVEHKAKVVVHVDGVAASIASAIAMAGDEIIMAEAATMMIHEAWGGMFGTADEFESYARIMRLNNDLMAKLYADRTGNSVEQIKQWFTAEAGNLGTWMDASIAVERGFATGIAENARMAASAVLPLSALRAEMSSRLAEMRNHGTDVPVLLEQPIDAGVRPHYDAAAARLREVGVRSLAASSLRKSS